MGCRPGPARNLTVGSAPQLDLSPSVSDGCAFSLRQPAMAASYCWGSDRNATGSVYRCYTVAGFATPLVARQCCESYCRYDRE